MKTKKNRKIKVSDLPKSKQAKKVKGGPTAVEYAVMLTKTTQI